MLANFVVERMRPAVPTLRRRAAGSQDVRLVATINDAPRQTLRR